MRGKWMVPSWMRRRIARHLGRGTSERVIACLIGPVATAPDQPPRESDIVAHQDGPVDLTNVIPFRSRKGDLAHPASTAQRRPVLESLIESN